MLVRYLNGAIGGATDEFDFVAPESPISLREPLRHDLSAVKLEPRAVDVLRCAARD